MENKKNQRRRQNLLCVVTGLPKGGRSALSDARGQSENNKTARKNRVGATQKKTPISNAPIRGLFFSPAGKDSGNSTAKKTMNRLALCAGASAFSARDRMALKIGASLCLRRCAAPGFGSSWHPSMGLAPARRLGFGCLDQERFNRP